jgi:DNA polymerase-1
MERYFTEFPSVKQARYKFSDETRNQGYMTNYFGRRRYLDESECYKGFNTKIQGSAADLAKLGLARVYRELQYNGGQIACLLQIHDEVVYLSEGDPKIDRQVLELLNDTQSFRIPIIADVSGSKSTWQDKRELKLAA